jgi:hypothetical protein
MFRYYLSPLSVEQSEKYQDVAAGLEHPFWQMQTKDAYRDQVLSFKLKLFLISAVCLKFDNQINAY